MDLNYKIKINKNDLKNINAKEDSSFVLVFEDELNQLKDLLNLYKVNQEDVNKLNIKGIELNNTNSSGFKLTRKTILTTLDNLELLNKKYNDILKEDLIAVADLKGRENIKIKNYEFPKDKIVFENKRKYKI